MFILNKYTYSANKQMDDRTRIPRFVFFIEISRFFFLHIGQNSRGSALQCDEIASYH